MIQKINTNTMYIARRKICVPMCHEVLNELKTGKNSHFAGFPAPGLMRHHLSASLNPGLHLCGRDVIPFVTLWLKSQHYQRTECQHIPGNTTGWVSPYNHTAVGKEKVYLFDKRAIIPP